LDRPVDGEERPAFSCQPVIKRGGRGDRRDFGGTDQSFLTLAPASGIETPTRAYLARRGRMRPKDEAAIAKSPPLGH